MNILVLTHFDADNLRIVNILKELKRRGHHLSLYCRFLDEQNIRMFKDLNEEYHNLNSLTSKVIEEHDIIFTSLHGQSWVKFANKYVFFFNHYFDDHWLTQGADFMFTACPCRNLEFKEDCASMPIGEPKNDSLVQMRKSSDSKRILYIDTGHFPFGKKGKVQIANMLIKICDKYPDYELVIKPRWLPNKNFNVTHRNSMHIYDVIKECCVNRTIPNNLIMLLEHRDMQELLDESILAITTCSSAYLDIVLRGKNILIVEGFDSEDKFDFRINVELKEAYEQKRDSGCVVHFKNIFDYLPLGLKCNEKHIDKTVTYRSDASLRAADVMEYIYNNFLMYGKFPENKAYRYETFKSEMHVDNNLNYTVLQSKRMRNCVLELLNIRFTIDAPISFKTVYENLNSNYKAYSLTAVGYHQLILDTQHNIWETILEQKELLMDDSINQSRLFQALYELNQIDRLFSFPMETILCKNIYYYYMGLIYKANKSPSQALLYLGLYLQEANSRPYAKYIQEQDWAIKDVYSYIFNSYNGENLEPKLFADLYLSYYESRAVNLVSYSARQRAHNRLPKVAEALAEKDPAVALKCLQLFAKWNYHYNIRAKNDQINQLNNELQKAKRLLWVYYLVLKLFRKSVGGYRCVKENGLKYTIRHGIEKLKSKFRGLKKKITNISAVKIWSIYNHKVKKGFQLYARVIEKYGENSYLFLSGASTGDPYIYSLFFDAYTKKNYPDNVAIFATFGQSGLEVTKLFKIKYAEGFSADEFRYLWNVLLFDQQNILHLESLHYHVVYRHTSILMHLEGVHGFNLLSLSKEFLGITSNSEVVLPQFDSDITDLMTVMQANNLIPGRTILLVPNAKSVARIPLTFWVNLTNKLKSCGFTVCTNSIGDSEPPIIGTCPIFIPYSKLVPFLEKCGAVVGLRSGLFDIASTAKCPKITLYPYKSHNRSIACKDYESFSMIDMYHEENQYDIIYSVENTEEIIQQIINQLQASLN